jgi:hypothetical protein
MPGAKRALVLSALFLALPAAGSGFPPLAPLPGTGSLGTPATGGYHHYLVVQVSGAKVTATMVEVDE